MDKKTKIQNRIKEHKQELERLLKIPKTLPTSKGIQTQIFHIQKAIYILTGKYIKAGGVLEDLTPKAIKKKPTPTKKKAIKKVPKTRRGKKKKK